jgi:hypothetical protein
LKPVQSNADDRQSIPALQSVPVSAISVERDIVSMERSGNFESRNIHEKVVDSKAFQHPNTVQVDTNKTTVF